MHEEIYRTILKVKKNGRRCVLVTVVDKKGSGPARMGAKMLVLENGKHIGTIGGGSLEQIAIRKALSVLETRKPLLEKYNLNESSKDGIVLSGMVCGGNVMVFYEYAGAGYPVYVFGAGHVGEHVIRLLSEMDYFVNVIEPRREFVKGLPKGVKIYNTGYADFFKNPPKMKDAFVFVATPNHHTDLAVLKGIYSLGEQPLYVGLLASRRKAKTIIEELKSEINDLSLSNLYTPCGLDIGGDTPFEIAIAVVSEIQGIRNARKNLPHRRMTWYIS